MPKVLNKCVKSIKKALEVPESVQKSGLSRKLAPCRNQPTNMQCQKTNWLQHIASTKQEDTSEQTRV